MTALELPFGNVRATDPDTSHAAGRLPRQTLRAAVEACLRDHPDGLTDFELCELLGQPDRRKPSVGKRRQETGATDTTRRRLSPDGNLAVVWAVRP